MKTTEKESLYKNLESQPFSILLTQINKEDHTVANIVKNSLLQVEKLVQAIFPRMKNGGRLFYIGAGTSGRIGILDASECPPTFGVSQDLVVGIIAGGDVAIRKSVEFAEDSKSSGWSDLKGHKICALDSVIGISASGSTPYVISALKSCQSKSILTGCITSNLNSELSLFSDFPIELELGPEYITGSTRMKSGSAQKMVLNMISTCLMIRLGKVKGNKMVDMQLTNNKLVERGVQMIVMDTNLDPISAKTYLLEYGSVRNAIKAYKSVK